MLKDFLKPSAAPESQKCDDDPKSEVAKAPDASEVPANGTSDLSGDAVDTATFVNPNDPETLAAAEAKQKISNRRRASDLTHLQQWGWHKNRRSSRKKSIQDVTETEDTTINGFLKRTLNTYFSETFSSTSSPFVMDVQENNSNDTSETECLNKSQEDSGDYKSFHEASKDSFNTFVDQIKDRHFDVIIPIFEWLKYLSIYWNEKMPNELCELYIKVYELHESFIDYSSLHHLEDDNFRASYGMVLFYFELTCDKVEDSLKSSEKL